MVDVILEKLHILFKTLFLTGLLTILAFFSFGFVFAHAPLKAWTAFSNHELYNPGQNVSGITWRDEFAYLNITIKNLSERYYDDLEFHIKTDAIIAGIACTEHSGNYEVAFEPMSGYRLLSGTYQLIATDVGYRMNCSRLPPKGQISIVLAIAAIPTVDEINGNPDKYNALAASVFDKVNGSYKIVYGEPWADIYSARPTKPPLVSIDGLYTAGQRRRHFIMSGISDTPKHNQ